MCCSILIDCRMHFFDVVQAIALDFASWRRACKLIPSQTASARSSMDRASDYGSEGWGFESLRARSGPPRCDPPVGVLHFYQALLRECFFHAHPLVVVPASRFPVRSEMTAAQQRAYLSGNATELAQHAPFREKVRPARHKPPFLGHFSCAGRTFSRTGSCDVTMLKPPSPQRPLMQTNVKPPSPLQPKNAPKTPISRPQRRWRFQLRLGRRPQRRWGFQTTGPPGRQGLAAAPVGGGGAWPSNQRAADVTNVVKPEQFEPPLASAHVTNVVNLRPKTLIFSEKALGLTTFVTTDQKSTRKTPPIDDVCNSTQRSAPKSQHDRPDHIGGPENPAAVPVGGGGAWPGNLQRPSPTGVEGAGGTGGHGRASRRGAERSEAA